MFTDLQAEAFRTGWKAGGLAPLVAHAPYPANIASSDTSIRRSSVRLLRTTVATAAKLGVGIVVVHAGSGGAASEPTTRRRAAGSLRQVIDSVPHGVTVAVELMAGTSNSVASTLDEAEALFEAVDVAGLGLCLDTCHLYAAGYPLDSPQGVTSFDQSLAASGLLPRVCLVHANDSVFGRGEHRDRHADIGGGPLHWGALTTSSLRDVPWIMETPGDAARQRDDLAHLRSLAAAG
jgi:deoxyribonuclease-4